MAVQRLPSVKTLSRVFGSFAKDARKILESSHSNQRKLVQLDDICATSYGVESIKVEGQSFDAFAEYLNVGETYEDTLILDENSQWIVESLGGFVERKEAKGWKFP